MQYSIVMPVYQRIEELKLTLDSILSQSKKPLELIIVDNNTNDKTIQRLKHLIRFYNKKFLNKISYIKSPINSGAKARNIGALRAKAELVAFLDSDVILDQNYYEILVEYFDLNQNLIGIQGLDRSLLEKNYSVTSVKIIDKLIYYFEQFFETTVLLNRKTCYVSPSLTVAHPNLKKDFELKSEWISTCAGVFKRSLFQKYQFPDQFVTYSNNEYLMFSYNLIKNFEGTMIYTSKAKYRDIQTSKGRISRVQLMYQVQSYDLYIFLKLFDKNLKNIFIYFKSRIGYLFYYILRLIFKRNFSLKLYLHAFGSIFYPAFHFFSILKGDLSFYEKDFPPN